MANFLILHGPNLNLLGSREPELYGKDTLEDINGHLEALSRDLGHQLTTYQSNAEHLLIEKIHDAFLQKTDFIIINPAGFTHTSIALRDALLATRIPFIEVHLSNLFAREHFRQKSYFADIAVGVIAGIGSLGYESAFHAGIKYLIDKEHYGYS